MKTQNSEATEGRASIVKGEKSRQSVDGGWTCKNPVGVCLCDSPIETVKYIWMNIDACLIRFCHETTKIHFLNQGVTQKLWEDIALKELEYLTAKRSQKV